MIKRKKTKKEPRIKLNHTDKHISHWNLFTKLTDKLLTAYCLVYTIYKMCLKIFYDWAKSCNTPTLLLKLEVQAFAMKSLRSSLKMRKCGDHATAESREYVSECIFFNKTN